MTPSRHSYGIVVLFWFLRKNMFCGSVIFGRGLYINCILTMHTNLCGSHEGSSFMSAVCHKECIVCNSLRITYTCIWSYEKYMRCCPERRIILKKNPNKWQPRELKIVFVLHISRIIWIHQSVSFLWTNR